ncbi:response regulator with CheY-like receiver, AAA-type ATPase, and DNA-binding domains [Terriglobus roseus DSM 18391]|uniref:Response regulator with CheY-like receiver, AAA-type ATPase, and DNA-binding domains n=1 Tax=Terriglobus roseus (strain DSM 18391 / NRRL B-41598 / KBS 63) TaxID=926566 RepID=I3ZFF9_TERRK|nr:sigma-54 dependent transcriptional regulator [Terriglobus roseus]AFL87977.1 response regulator with CheY-like receiver, AAA-type ATPase, and DNA-binding domains [Terriglobus roseus DSM 18391]
MPEVLIVDDDHNFRETIRELLTNEGYKTLVATNAEEGIALLQTNSPDLTLCDWKMPGGGGEQFLKSLQSEGLLTSMPVIILTAHGTGPNAMQAMQLGAYDFITKPLDIDQALATVARAIRDMELQREVELLRLQRFQDRALDDTTRSGEDRKPQLVGNSAAWIEVFKNIGRVASTDVGVLLLGESGTGKEVVARAIHKNSARSTRPFIILNCAALPPELLESELFGHERGAFTGAIAQKRGKFEAADGGTIFLDEIGELPLSLQPKLLRVLQEHTFERVGGTASIATDVRVIAATNRSLEDEVERRTFRADLFYRLNAFTVRLPPLRERQSDILPLAEYFLARYTHRNQLAPIGLAADAVVALQQYSFPGNVRELEHLIERAAVKAGGRAIAAEQILQEMTRAKTSASGAFDIQAALSIPFHEAVAAWERYLIEQALEASRGNKSDAARRLGIHRRLLYEKLTQFDM